MTCYRGAEPPNPEKCSGRCLGSAGPRWAAREGAWEGAWEGAREGARPPFLSIKNRSRAPFPSTLPSTFPSTPPEQPTSGLALPQAPPGALFGVRGFGTSVAGQATRNPKKQSPKDRNKNWNTNRKKKQSEDLPYGL